LELIEYGPDIVVEMSDTDARALVSASARWRSRLALDRPPISVTPASEGSYSIAARDVAGFIKVGNHAVDIAPKFLSQDSAGPQWRRALWRFLAYGGGIETLDDGAGLNVDSSLGVADLLADIYLASLAGSATRGFALGYRSHRIQSQFVRGRLDPRGFARLLPPTGRVGVISTSLTRDVPLNRLLKWAGLELARTVDSTTRRRRLLEWANGLEGVAPLPPEPQTVHLSNRHHPHLMRPAEIALMLLNDTARSHHDDARELPGFLWDSEDLFERSVRRLFREAAQPLSLRVAKRRHKLAKLNDAVPEHWTFTVPDLDVHDSHRSVLMVDAKYKAVGLDPSASDMYQVLAAGRVRGTSSVALVYPKTSGPAHWWSFSPEGNGLPSRVFIMTLGIEEFATSARLDALRGSVRRFIEEATTAPTR